MASMTTALNGAVIDDALSADLAAAALMLARRFSAGGTLWCVSPEWEPHANHVAVEFVHPVIVGKKALPAVALTGRKLIANVRVSVRPGDVVLAVASADDPAVRSVMRRAPAWGASTLWIGSGDRPPAGAGGAAPGRHFPRRTHAPPAVYGGDSVRTARVRAVPEPPGLGVDAVTR